MSIVALRKASLIGLVSDKRPVLEGLQQLGCMHLLPLRPVDREEAGPAAPETLQQALKFLMDCPLKRRQSRHERAFDPEVAARKVLEVKHRLGELRDARDLIAKRIVDLEPWGDFRLPPEGALYGYRFWFYTVPLYKMRHVGGEDLVWHEVHRDNRFAYLVVISRKEPPADAMPVPRTHTGAVPLRELKRSLERLEVGIEELEAERQGLTKWIFLLSNSLAAIEDQSEMANAEAGVHEDPHLFAVQGWAPADRRDALRAFSEKHGLALVWERPGHEERPPTLLDNPESMAGGEEVVKFFQSPGYRTWDPSRLIFFSFAVFFAMILSDTGYALMFGLAVLAFWKRMGGSPVGRRLRAMSLAMTAAAAVYGVLVGSYFGAPPPAFLAPFKVLDVNDFDAMMQVSVLVGGLHVTVANLSMALQKRRRLSSLAPVGWILLIGAGLAYYLTLGAGLDQLHRIEAGVAILGAAMIFLFSSERPIGKPGDIAWRVFDGLAAMTGLSKAFGDVLSYLRLFALGLASAALAVTFNQLAADVREALPAMGLFAAMLILILGHALNFVLALVSGVVHGLRLNLIEFYNWCISEEGYPFRPFAKKEVPTWNSSS